MMMRPNRNSRDPLIFFSVLTVAAIVVGILWLISRNADSAGVASNVNNVDPTPYTGSEACNNWATYWLNESGVNPPATALETISVCRETADGSWIIPANASDERILRPVTFTAAEQAQVQNLSNQIQSSIERFQLMESGELKDAINVVYDPLVNGPDGHLVDGKQISPTRKLYNDEMNDFLNTPGNEALAAYVKWVVPYRKAAFDQFMAGCNGKDFDYLDNTCDGTGDSMSVNWIPWTWDLSDSLLLDAYLRAVLDGKAGAPAGYVPAG